MPVQQFTEKIADIDIQKIGKIPVVVLPLADWEKIENLLEEYEMNRSRKYLKSIRQARIQAKKGLVYQLDLKKGNFRKLK